MRQYYSNTGEKVSSLIQKYKIDIQPSKLYTLFPNIACKETCEWCGSQLELLALSKTAMTSRDQQYKKRCPGCSHTLNDKMCECDMCKTQREKIKYEKERQEREHGIFLRKQIQKVYRREAEGLIKFEDIGFLEKVYLGAIARGFLSEDLNTILPIEPSVLSPDGRISADIVNKLTHQRILVVDPVSDIEDFVQDENFPKTYYIFKVKYGINLHLPPDKGEFIKQIMYPSALKEEDKETAYILWKTIAIEECIQYLIYQLEQVRFEFAPGDKTYAIFEELLAHYSVSQIFGIIWRKVSDAARFYQEGGITKKHAANTVIGGCLSFGERARINNWDITQYSRIKELPQTLISQFFFNQVLHIGEMGFHMPPTRP
ncbi:MAG TPA: hypothetical protein GX707_12465 [Epulopiscium sp.]|nr:hypothetical protein [Candidatus Epulonipiscium sp.]